jgi:hypothetical protein
MCGKKSVIVTFAVSVSLFGKVFTPKALYEPLRGKTSVSILRLGRYKNGIKQMAYKIGEAALTSQYRQSNNELTKERLKSNFPLCSYHRQTVVRQFPTVWRPWLQENAEVVFEPYFTFPSDRNQG